MPKRYGKGTLKPLPNGKCDAYISIAGKVLRKRLSSVHEAKAWLDAQDAHSVADLTAIQIKDAATALAILPAGVSLTQVAQDWILTHKASNASAAIEPIIEHYLDARSRELRYNTLRTYKRMLAIAVREIGANITDYTPARIRERIAPLSAYEQLHMLQSLSAFFEWCIDRDYAVSNPCERIKPPKLEEPRRAVLTLAQAEHLLRTAITTNPSIAGYFAVCLFAGLRPTEAQRLTMSDIGDEYITLTANTTKTASARTVPLAPGLRQFLDRYPLAKHSQSRYRYYIAAVIKASAIDWSPDIMRHSYASYEYERSRDAAATAYTMGHRGTDVFFRHYRGLVPPRSGAQFFAILQQFCND